jgi:hypothetical protein
MFEKGVLEIRIPKPEERRPRRVSIRVGEQAEPAAIEGSEHQPNGTQPAGAAA